MKRPFLTFSPKISEQSDKVDFFIIKQILKYKNPFLGNKKAKKNFENFSLIFVLRDNIKCIPIFKKLYF